MFLDVQKKEKVGHFDELLRIDLGVRNLP